MIKQESEEPGRRSGSKRLHLPSLFCWREIIQDCTIIQTLSPPPWHSSRREKPIERMLTGENPGWCSCRIFQLTNRFMDTFTFDALLTLKACYFFFFQQPWFIHHDGPNSGHKTSFSNFEKIEIVYNSILCCCCC